MYHTFAMFARLKMRLWLERDHALNHGADNIVTLRGEIEIVRRKLNVPMVLHPKKWLNHPLTLTRLMKKKYLAHLMPMIMFTSKAKHESVLHGVLSLVAGRAFGPDASARICFLCGKNQHEP